ncbi:MAG TPA: 2-oxo-4-hydroxy-4-carboxy-5-ureidoimidazoline decarboxylase [Terriglobia bacterium]|nr:2-oxo-4-hydroxy-4-carboxy-5-ureidoimidazoline decarboxylase [Terriglobia bacterium]
MSIDELNSLDRPQFVEAIGWVFEHSPWVAERAFEAGHVRPFPDIEALHAALVAEVEKAKPEEQLALLRAHPDLGTRARISSASAEEQAGAGLSALTPLEFDRFQRLNSEYRARFGFPFLFAVKGSSKYDVLQALEQRVGATPDAEYHEALQQVYRIAEFRLRDVIG